MKLLAATLIGTWHCYLAGGGHAPSDLHTIKLMARGKMTSTTSEGDRNTTYAYANGKLTQIFEGEPLTEKLVWKGANAFDLIGSDSTEHCTRVH